MRAKRCAITLICSVFAAGWSCESRGETWDFSYGYDSVFSPNAEDYTVGLVNTFKHDEGDSKFYQPHPANLDEAVITMRFDFPEATEDAHLTARIATYTWWFGEGWGRLYGSKDGSNWEQLMYAPPPESEGGEYWKYDDLLPTSLLGGKELWFQAVLDCTNTSGVTAPWSRATAQFSRGVAGDGIDAFHLNVNLVPEPSTLVLLTIGAAGLLVCGLRRRRRSSEGSASQSV